jgi:hypothetical protein
MRRYRAGSGPDDVARLVFILPLCIESSTLSIAPDEVGDRVVNREPPPPAATGLGPADQLPISTAHKWVPAASPSMTNGLCFTSTV